MLLRRGFDAYRVLVTPLAVSPRISWTTRFSHTQAMSRDIETVDLAYEKFEPKGPEKGNPIVFLHGLFGSKTNNRTVSKVFVRDLGRAVYCLDLRNHGDSPHIRQHDYSAMAADVEAFMHKHNLGPAVLIGHSMGAKTAMGVALRSPDLVSELISVDNAPVDALLGSSFSRYIQGMQEVERAQVHNSKQAYAIMGKYEKSLPIQQFLLANLKKTHTGVYRFRVPLDTLGRELAKVADFPWDPRQVRFEKPTLFIRGTHSYYVSDEAFPVIGEFFPKFQMRDIDAGHWVISEKPHEFIQCVEEFLDSDT